MTGTETKATPPSGPADQTDEPDPSLYNPEDWPVWTIVMVLAWIATRDMDRVRWQMDGWRRAVGLPESTAALAAIDAELDDDEPPMGFPAIPAITELRRQCEAGAIVATALSSASGDSGPIPADKWTYGDMSFDHDLREVWNAPKARYSRITFKQGDVLRLWPASGLADGNEPTKTGVPGRPSSMYLVEAEFDRRRAAGEPLEDSLRAEADSLLAWFERSHPGAPNLTAKTIRNRLATKYRTAEPPVVRRPKF